MEKAGEGEKREGEGQGDREKVDGRWKEGRMMSGRVKREKKERNAGSERALFAFFAVPLSLLSLTHFSFPRSYSFFVKQALSVPSLRMSIAYIPPEPRAGHFMDPFLRGSNPILTADKYTLARSRSRSLHGSQSKSFISATLTGSIWWRCREVKRA